jgi:hypothetical protein
VASSKKQINQRQMGMNTLFFKIYPDPALRRKRRSTGVLRKMAA